MSSSPDDEKDIIRRVFPRDTQPLLTQGVSGWVYRIFDIYGTQYTLFAYRDEARYQVKVVFPEVEHRFDRRAIQLSDEGTLYPSLCPNDDGVSGFPNILEAFRESVLWANRFGLLSRSHEDESL